MMQFHQIYEVPPRHSPILLSHTRAGGSHLCEERRHEQRDETGRLVARYESVEEFISGRGRFRKYDTQGHLVMEGELPF